MGLLITNTLYSENGYTTDIGNFLDRINFICNGYGGVKRLDVFVRP